MSNTYKKLSDFGTATLHEAMGRKGNLPHHIKPINASMKLCGPAYTVRLKPYNNILLHQAYAYAEEGQIIIVDCQGGVDGGYWGDLLTLGAQQFGVKGLVIDGCVRDADEIEELNFPVFSRGLSVRGTGKDIEGSLNETITIGSVDIQPGDIIVGDRDGVVVVPKDEIEVTIEKAISREEKEAFVRQELLKGKNSLEIYNWGEKYNIPTRKDT